MNDFSKIFFRLLLLGKQRHCAPNYFLLCFQQSLNSMFVVVEELIWIFNCNFTWMGKINKWKESYTDECIRAERRPSVESKGSAETSSTESVNTGKLETASVWENNSRCPLEAHSHSTCWRNWVTIRFSLIGSILKANCDGWFDYIIWQNARVIYGPVVCLICQSWPTPCNPLDCSPPGSSVHWILQARILEWVAISFFRGLPDPGIEPPSPTLQEESLPTESLGKPHTPKYA